MKTLFLTGVALVALSGVALAQAASTPTTPATAIHGLPGNNPANGGAAASPNGTGFGGGNGIHDIGDNPANSGYVPGQDGVDPAQSMHGGLDATTGRTTPNFDSSR